MRNRILLCVLLLLLTTRPSPAASETIDMSTENVVFAECVVRDDVGLLYCYVIHWPSGLGATGARYRVSRCNSTLVWLSDHFNFENTTGDSRTGVVVDYGACLRGPIVIQTVMFLGDRTSPANSSLKIMPHPASETRLVEGLSCDGEVTFPEPGGICIKPLTPETCYCNYLGSPYHNVPCLETVPVGSSTWGSIKVLYE